MNRYAALFRLFVKSSLLVELEYRANFLAQALLGVLWSGITFASVALFYSHTDALGGWSYGQAMIVVGMSILIGGVIATFFEANLQRIIAMVREGTMDFVLLKPVDSQFYCTLRHVRLSGLTDIFAGVAVLAYAFTALRAAPGLPELGAFLVMFAIALALAYSIWLAMGACAFWFVKIDNMQELFRTIWDTSRFPISAFTGGLRFALTFIAPVAFMTTAPAQALLGLLDVGTLLTAVVVCAAFYFAASRLWRRAVRDYSSASS
jgi:ABC-2 type transport system permease protein